MQLPVTAFYTGILALFALYLSFQAGSFRGKSGVSILYGDPIDMELAQRVRRHQKYLEYVPMIVIMMALIELNDGSTTFVHSVGALLIVARIAHAIGLQHANMGHLGRLIGAGGTALITLVTAPYMLGIVTGSLIG